MIKTKKLALFMLCFLIAVFFVFSSKKSDALVLSKTVSFFAVQDSIIENGGSTFSQTFVVTIPENAISIQSAYIKINGISFNSPGQRDITVDLQGGFPSTPRTFAIESSSRAQYFSINYNITSLLFNTSNAYTLYLTGNAGGAYSIFSAKLILNYEYDSVQSKFLKTSEFFVGQQNSKTSAGGIISKTFSISIPEFGAAIRSAFIEIGGSFKGTGVGSAQAGLYNSGAPIGYKQTYDFNLNAQSSPKFLIRYDALADLSVTNSDYVLHFTANKDINLWNAKLYLTYEYSGASGYPATGYAISSTFDTGSVKGAAFNSIMWRGNPNGGAVKLQFAAADCPNGKTNPPACDDAGSWTFLGSSCLDSDYFTNAFDVPQELGCFSNFNNKKYFRYKIVLCSDPTCAVSGPNNPQVDDVIVNWAP